jgi:hypothetical protein
MTDMGLTEYCQHLDHLDVGKLGEQLNTLKTNTASLAPYVKRKAEEYRVALDEQYSLLLKDICGRPPQGGFRVAA